MELGVSITRDRNPAHTNGSKEENRRQDHDSIMTWKPVNLVLIFWLS